MTRKLLLLHYCISCLFLLPCCQKSSTVKPENTNSIQTTTATLLFKIKAELGEGALWNHLTNELFWVDIEQKTFHVYDPASKLNTSYSMPSRIGTVVPYSASEVMVALEDGIYLFNRNTNSCTLFAQPELNGKDVRFNDGKCDPAGRLWAGTMHYSCKDPIGNLYMVLPNGEIVQKLDSITISNGIVWNAAKTKMYYIDTKTKQVVVFDYQNSTGAIDNKHVLIEIDTALGSPDGMAIDENDNLWIGLWNGNAVICIDHQSGEILHKIDVPAHNVTSCAFGGPNRDILYITTAHIDMTKEEMDRYPDAGSLFIAKPGVRGAISHHFASQ